MTDCNCVGVGPNGLMGDPAAHLAGCPAGKSRRDPSPVGHPATNAGRRLLERFAALDLAVPLLPSEQYASDNLRAVILDIEREASGASAELRELSDAATPGPWASGGDQVYAGSGDTYALVVSQMPEPCEDNAEFIAAAVNYVRAALGWME